MKEVYQFKYLGSILCELGRLEGEMRNKSCAREESGWMSRVYDERKDGMYVWYVKKGL